VRGSSGHATPRRAGVTVVSASGRRALPRARAPALLPPPERPFRVVEWRDAKAYPDCRVAIDHTLYSVPRRHVGKTPQARIGALLIELFDGDELVRTHPISVRGRRTDEADLLMRTPAWCRRDAAEVGGVAAGLLDAPLAKAASCASARSGRCCAFRTSAAPSTLRRLGGWHGRSLHAPGLSSPVVHHVRGRQPCASSGAVRMARR
jgi:hypothetical protein